MSPQQQQIVVLEKTKPSRLKHTPRQPNQLLLLPYQRSSDTNVFLTAAQNRRPANPYT